MDFSQSIEKVVQQVRNANDILVLTHERATHDSIGSSLALSLALQGLGKRVTVATPDPILVEHANYIGVDKVTQEIGKKNFVISLDYEEGSIEKVSYNIEGNKFNLVIEPRVGFQAFSQDKVNFTHTGVACDLIFIVDTIHLGGLKKFYEGQSNAFAEKTTINIDRHPNNANFGQINIIDSTASATVEVVYQVITALGLPLTDDIATNILNALYFSTNNFQSQYVRSQTFELAAACLKAGGNKFGQAHQPIAEEVPQKEQVTTPSPEMAMPQKTSPQILDKAPKNDQEAPDEWLKPKIFKSSNPLL